LRYSADLRITDKKDDFMKHLLLLTAIVLIGACSSTEPTMQTGPDAEVSFDGLHRVDHASMAMVWVRPGLDLSGYNKIRLVGAGIEYRSVKPLTGTTRSNSSRSEFPLDEKQKATFQKVVQEVFLEELRKSQYYTLVTEEGTDVLEIKGGLLDVVSSVPPDQMGRGDNFITKIGEATLVLEFRDSQSEEILARTADRTAFAPVYAQRSSRPMNVSEVRRSIRQWASLLTDRLDALHELGTQAQ